jgi:hypothetical protein
MNARLVLLETVVISTNADCQAYQNDDLHFAKKKKRMIISKLVQRERLTSGMLEADNHFIHLNKIPSQHHKSPRGTQVLPA